jgi:hypothetical protein
MMDMEMSVAYNKKLSLHLPGRSEKTAKFS